MNLTGAPHVALAALSAVEWLFLASELAITVLGLAISYIAYVGYRRTEERAMLLFCIGFILVVGVPAVAGATVFGGGSEVLAGGVSQLSTLVGMALILFALRLDG